MNINQLVHQRKMIIKISSDYLIPFVISIFKSVTNLILIELANACEP